MPPDKRRNSILANNRIGRHNSPAYAGESSSETPTETPFHAAQEAVSHLHNLANDTGLTIKTIIECHRAMTKMGRTAHILAGTTLCRDIAKHRLADAVFTSPGATPLQHHRKACYDLAAQILDEEATPAETLSLAWLISERRLPPGQARTPRTATAAQALARERDQHPPGIWDDLQRCGQEDIPSDAMLAKIINSVQRHSEITISMQDTYLLYRRLKDNLP